MTSKSPTRERLLSEGLRVVHERGYSAASVRDIVRAAGVKQSSFTNHFVSKEAFHLEVLELYFQLSQAVVHKTLRNDGLPPLVRLRAFVDAQIEHIAVDNMRNGCLFGNFSAELNAGSESMRVRLVEIFSQVEDSIAYCLRAAATAGELDERTSFGEIARFIMSSLQGSILLAKTQLTAKPVEEFREILFSTVLRRQRDQSSFIASGASAQRSNRTPLPAS